MSLTGRIARLYHIWIARHKYAVHMGEIAAMERQIKQCQDYLAALREMTSALSIAVIDAEHRPEERHAALRQPIVKPRIKARAG